MENLEQIIKDSISWNEVCKKVYGYKGSWQTNKIRSIAIQQNIDYSHFVKVIRYNTLNKLCPVCDIPFITKDGPNEKHTCSHSCANTYFKTEISSRGYRKRAIKHYGSKCRICSENRIHVLQVHHKDEDRNNNHIDNLDVLCANCHLDLHYLSKV